MPTLNCEYGDEQEGSIRFTFREDGSVELELDVTSMNEDTGEDSMFSVGTILTIKESSLLAASILANIKHTKNRDSREDDIKALTNAANGDVIIT